MNLIDTKHLRELAENATPGPWITKDLSIDDHPWWWVWRGDSPEGYAAVGEMNVPSGHPADAELDERGIISADATDGAEPHREKADAEYIAAIDPPTLLALLDELEGHRRWKAEAVDVLLEWEKTWVAAGRPGRLGTSKAVGVRDEIERLRGDAGWEYYAEARKGYVAGEPRVHERGAIQAYEEALDRVVFEQEDETPVVFKRRVGPWELVEEKTDD